MTAFQLEHGALETAEGDLLATLAASGQLTPTGLTLGDADFDTWQEIGSRLGRLRDLTAWALGDWLLWGEGRYGEDAAQAVEATGRSKATLLEYVRVARQIPTERRRSCSSFTHHQVVASMAPDEQAAWLDRSEAS